MRYTQNTFADLGKCHKNLYFTIPNSHTKRIMNQIHKTDLIRLTGILT